MPSALESSLGRYDRVPQSNSIEPVIDWNLTHSKLLSQYGDYSTSFKEYFYQFEWHKFTNLFEILHADFEIFILQN